MKYAVALAVVVIAALAVLAFTSGSPEPKTEPGAREIQRPSATHQDPIPSRIPARGEVARDELAIGLPVEAYLEVIDDLTAGRAVLLDVRDQHTWDGGYIEGAVSFPWAWLQEYDSADNLNTIPLNKVVYTYGDASGNAVQAATLLSKLGFDARPFEHSYEELAKRFRTRD